MKTKRISALVTRCMAITVLALTGISACGGSTATAVDLPEPAYPRGFGVRRGAASTHETARPSMGRIVVEGEVRERAVRLRKAFLLTPDVEGPMELHAFEDEVDRSRVCPGGLPDDPPSASLKVMLPDLRTADDPALAYLHDGGASVRLSRIHIDVTGPMRPGGLVTATIDVEGSDGSHLRGWMPAHVCVDKRGE
jgi:hypothetical protein